MAREMERQGFKLPLLIGGATTSRAHTAIKIAPHYSEPVVHVLDASRAVPVTTSLLSDDGKDGVRGAASRRVREARARPTPRRRRSSFRLRRRARRRTPIEWRAEDIAAARVHRRARARRLSARDAPRIHRLDAVLPHLGAEGRLSPHPRRREARRAGAPDLRGSATPCSTSIIEKNAASRRAACTDSSRPTPSATMSSSTRTQTRTNVLERFHFLRQQANREGSEPCRSLERLHRAEGNRLPDHIGAFAVTSGHRLEGIVRPVPGRARRLQRDHGRSLADRLAEAFAECLHKRVRDEWGYGREEDADPADLIQEKYRGIRPAAGYPACPDHTEKGPLWQLLDVEANTGMQITESFAMWPGVERERAVLCASRVARISRLGKIDRDQVADYSERKGMTVAEVERWLGPNLNYDPPAPA